MILIYKYNDNDYEDDNDYNVEEKEDDIPQRWVPVTLWVKEEMTKQHGEILPSR